MSELHSWPPDFVQAAKLLLKAAKFAEAANCSNWEFAVEIAELKELGLSWADLRWLICEGLLEHADELPTASLDLRSFRATSKLTLSQSTCFVLTAIGGDAAREITSL